MAKKGDINWLLVVAVVALGYFLLVGNPFEQEPEPATTPTPSPVCGVEDISFEPKMTRMGKAGTALTGSSENYYIITDSIGSTNGGSSVTLPTYYDVKVMFGEASTTYYTKVETINTECEDPYYHAVQLAYADSSLNTKYLENSDGTVNSGSNKEALGTGETFETTVYIKAGADTYFGNPYSSCENVAVCEYDKTYILSCKGDDPVPVPGAFSYTNSTYDGSNAFVIPKSADGEKVSFNLQIETSGSNDPVSTAQPKLTLYDCDIDKDEDTLELIEDVEDEDLNSIALQSQTLEVYIS